MTFGDRMVLAARDKGNSCAVGLDPRVESMPSFITQRARASGDPSDIGLAISAFHEQVLDAVGPLVPAVKLQVAFYEQHGIPGMQAFADTIAMARSHGLVVLVDAKRNDIDSTAQAYANAFLGRTPSLGRLLPAFDVDCITVSPFLGRDSLEPFVETCAEHGKGIFVLVKTSNPGSADIQDSPAPQGGTISEQLARLVDELGGGLVGAEGYSSIGAVVGATFPHEAQRLRQLMPNAIILVPGYGAQGGTADGAAANFNADGLGAVVNASRSVTYDFGDVEISEEDFIERVRNSVIRMVDDINGALAVRTEQPA